jgi:hypothetical protein
MLDNRIRSPRLPERECYPKWKSTMKTASPTSLATVLRNIMAGDVDMPMDQIVKKVRAKGLAVTDKTIVNNVYMVRSALRKEKSSPTAAKPTIAVVAPKPAEVVAAVPTPASAASKPAVPAPKPTPAVALPEAGPDLADVFANVRLVNKVADECGGIDAVRQVTKAIQACGSVDDFLRHVELVASLKAK